MKNIIQKGSKIEESLILKYKNVLPYELIEIWVNYGFANMLDGYLKVINPDEYKEILDDTYFRGEFAIPILITAFGDIITIEEEQYIGIVKYKNGVFDIISKSFKRFLQNIKDDYFLEKYFEIYKYTEIVEKIGFLDSGIGGVTVLRECIKKLSNFEYILN